MPKSDVPDGTTSEPVDGEAFDRILERAGNDGPFQRRFNYVFTIGNSMLVSLVYYNIIMAMHTPAHWCHVPGRKHSNYTPEQWKDATLPRELYHPITISHNQCQMYNITINPATGFTNTSPIVDCEFGYKYDRTWFRNTIVTERNWVCDKELYKFNALMLDKFGEVVGLFIFGQLGDRLGRRALFKLSLFALICGRIVQILFSSTFWLFAMAAVLANMFANTAFSVPYIIAIETQCPEKRGQVGIVYIIARTLGMSLIPLVYWLVNDWQKFMLITSLPLTIYLCCPIYMIESPRWLASQEKWDRCAKYLNRIATINGNNPVFTGESLKKEMPISKDQPKYGIMSLCLNRRMTQITLLMIVSSSCTFVANFILILLISQLPGNPFINFFGLTVVEIPGFIVGGYLCNRYGRRLTNFGLFALAAGLCAAAIPIILYTRGYYVFMTVLIKLCVSTNISSIILLMPEVFPTCVRQTGISMCFIFTNIVGMLAPYVVMAEKYDPRYPFLALGILFVVGCVCAVFLPETLHQKLPDTIEDMKSFGIGQKFWSTPTKPKLSDERNLAAA